MSTYNNLGRGKHATLTASAVDKLLFTVSSQDYELVNLGLYDIYVRTDSTDPAVLGDDAELVRAGEALTVHMPAGSADVRLISSGASEYHVRQLT